MKTTDKNEKGINVLPFAVVQKAVEGDIVSINKVMKHYGNLRCGCCADSYTGNRKNKLQA